MPPEKYPRNTPLFITGEAVEFSDIEAAAGEDKKLRSFKMLAYTGGPMNVRDWYHAVVIDLATLKSDKQVRIFRDHREDKLLGHAEKVEIAARRIRASGVLTNERSVHVREVSDTSRNGTLWQSSIGVGLTRAPELVAENATAKVNGRTVKGPVYIIRAGVLREISFVLYGADEATSAQVAATGKETHMDFQSWLEARGQAEGFDPAELSESNVAALKLIYEAEVKAKKKTQDTPAPDPEPKKVAAKATDADPGDADPLADLRQTRAAEHLRIAAVEKAAEGHPDIAAKAVGEGWSEEKTELTVLRAARPTPPALVQGKGSQLTERVVEAAIRMGSEEKRETVEAAYDEKILEAAHKIQGMGLRAFIEVCCRMGGHAIPSLHAGTEEWVRAAFSTAAVPNILSNTANKMMHDSFKSVPVTATRFGGKLSANDFKTHTGVNLNASGVMAKVGAAGELTHGKVTDDAFTYSVDTYGEIIGISRTAWINDDLGAFTSIPVRIGRKAARTLEYTFWALVKANTGSFFATANGNYKVSSPIDATGYNAATQLLGEMVDSNDVPILATPKYVAVPPALHGLALGMYKSQNYAASGVTSSRKLEGGTNIYQGLYEPSMVRDLKGSNTNWYLFADPNDVAAFGIAYLRGNETPVVEDAPLASDMLGRAWRGYFDFGVCQIDEQGAVKLKTTA